MADLRECLAGMTEGVMAVDGEQRILLWNHAAERLLGVSAQDELGARLCRRACRAMTLAKQGKPIPTSEILTLAKKGGKQLWLNAMYLMLSSGRGDRGALAVIFRDVSRRKEMERTVQQLSTFLASLCARSRADQVLPDREAVPLTPREGQVLKRLSEECGTRAIAGQLGVSPATVKNHIHNILRKLGVHSCLEAVTLAGLQRLLS